MKRTAVAALLLFCGSAQAADAGKAPQVTSVRVFSGDATITGQKIEVPNKPKVVVSLTTFPPGSRLRVHKHLYPHYVYVLEGTLTVTNVDTGKTFDVPKGRFFAEMTNTWHFGRNNGTTPVKILVIDQLPPGVTSNVIVKSP